MKRYCNSNIHNIVDLDGVNINDLRRKSNEKSIATNSLKSKSL